MSAGTQLSEQTRRRLTVFLQSLPASTARRLAAAVADAERAGDTALPHRLILEALRPGGTVPAEREFFARPFADLVTQDGRGGRPGRIARSAVERVHAGLDPVRPEGDLSPAGALRLYRGWAGQIEELAADPRDKAMPFGPATALSDASLMAVVLHMADTALALQDRVPKPLKALTAGELDAFTALFESMAAPVRSRRVAFFLLVAARLERPWEVLRVLDHVAERVPGALLAADRDAVAETLFADLEAQAEAFRPATGSRFEPSSIARRLHSFTRLANGLNRLGEVACASRTRRLMACRGAIAERMEILMERAPRDIFAALPVHKMGSFGRVRCRPDTGMPPDTGRTEQALRMAGLMDRCRPFAAEAGFKVAFSEAAADIRNGLSEYAAGLFDGLSGRDTVSAEGARAYLDLVIRLTVLAIGPEEAESLRRTAAAHGLEGLNEAAVS